MRPRVSLRVAEGSGLGAGAFTRRDWFAMLPRAGLLDVECLDIYVRVHRGCRWKFFIPGASCVGHRLGIFVCTRKTVLYRSSKQKKQKAPKVVAKTVAGGGKPRSRPAKGALPRGGGLESRLARA